MRQETGRDRVRNAIYPSFPINDSLPPELHVPVARMVRYRENLARGGAEGLAEKAEGGVEGFGAGDVAGQPARWGLAYAPSTNEFAGRIIGRVTKHLNMTGMLSGRRVNKGEEVPVQTLLDVQMLNAKFEWWISIWSKSRLQKCEKVVQEALTGFNGLAKHSFYHSFLG